MSNEFLEAMSERSSEARYKEFVKKNGKPKYLTEELAVVGLLNFVPFFNTRCTRGSCVYDLSQIEHLYGAKYDMSDDFKEQGDFDCHYCDENIRFGDFFTAQALTDNLEELFHKIKPSKKNPGSSKNLDSPKPIRRGAENGSMPIKTILNLLPSLESKQSVGKLMANFLSGKNMTKRVTAQIQDVATLKLRLMKFEVPDFRVKVAAKAESFCQDIIRSKAAQFKIRPREEFIIGELLEAMPSFEELQDFLALRRRPERVLSLLLAYWRARLCKERGKLLSLWMFAVPQTGRQIKRCDGLLLDTRVIYANPDSTYLNLVFIEQEDYLLVEFCKTSGELTYVHFLPSKANALQDHRDLDRVSETAFDHFEKANADLFEGKLIVTSRRSEIVRSECHGNYCIWRFVLDKYFGCDASTLAQVDSITKHVVMELGLLLRTGVKPELNLSIIDSEKGGILQSKEGPLISPANSSGSQNFKFNQIGSRAQIRSTKLVVSQLGNQGQASKAKIALKTQSGLDAKMIAGGQKTIKSRKELSETLAVDEERRVVHVKKPSISRTLQLEDSVTNFKPDSLLRPTPSSPERAVPKINELSQLFTAAKNPPKKPPIFRVSKDNMIRDASKSLENSEAKQEAKDSQLQDIKRLLNFYFSHDRSRYKYLAAKCQNSFGASFLNKINIGQSIAAISKPETARGKSLPRVEAHHASFARQASTDSSVHLPRVEGDTTERSVGNKKTGALVARWYMGKNLPLIDHGSSRMLKKDISDSLRGSFDKENRGLNSIAVTARNSARSLIIFEGDKEVRETDFNRILRIMEQNHLKDILSLKASAAQKSFLFKTEFFDKLVEGGNEQLVIRHKRVQSFTTAYSGPGHTIFDCFKKIIVPVYLEFEGVASYVVFIIEERGLKLQVFDPVASEVRGRSVKNFGKALAKYVCKEMELRTSQPFDKKAIALVDLPAPRDSVEASGVWALYCISKALEGSVPKTFSSSEKEDFVLDVRRLLSN